MLSSAPKQSARPLATSLLYEDLTFDVPAGAIVGIIGPNGAGKTTLFRMIVGQETPDDGELRVGADRGTGLCRPEPRYPRRQQDRLGRDLRGEWTYLDFGERKINSRAYVSRFNFWGTDQQKKVGTLSGGERNRVYLAKMLKSGANVLLLG